MKPPHSALLANSHDPVNFIIYVPLAAWLASGRVAVARLWPALTVAYLALALQNLVLHSPFGFSLDVGSWSLYGRFSLPVGSLALMTAALALRPRPMAALGLAGKYSLGLFALHKYAWYIVAALLGGLSVPGRTEVLPLITTTLAVALTCLAVWVLAVSPLRPLVTESPWRRRPMVTTGEGGSGSTSPPKQTASQCPSLVVRRASRLGPASRPPS